MAIVGARLAFNYAFSGTASRLAQQRGQTAAHRDGRKLLEEVWVLGGNILMLSIAGFVMAFHNGGCWFGNVRPCLAGWPNHSSDISTTLYYSLELAWYGHLLLKPVFNYGLADGRDMMLHHCASLALLIASCGLNLTRMGIVVLTLFGMSNPVLHAAKIANQLHMEKIRMPLFGAFALTFVITRVILVPHIVLIPAIVHSRKWLPYAYCICSAQCIALYTLRNAVRMDVGYIAGVTASGGKWNGCSVKALSAGRPGKAISACY